MKYLFISVVIIIIILIFYNQFGRKNQNGTIVKKSKLNETNEQIEQTKSYKGTLKKIDKKKYERFILTKNTTENYLLKMIKEYGELSGTEKFELHSFGIANYGDWKIIRVAESIDFYVYHNLVIWLTGYEKNPENPEISIGFAKNKVDNEEDYVFYLDANNEYGDTEIGVFKNGKSFFIYLPEAYEEYGNLMITNDIQVSMKENLDYILKKELDISRVESLNYSDHKIKMNE